MDPNNNEKLERLKHQFKDYATMDTQSNLLTEVGTRAAYGAVAGFGTGLVLFKSRNARRFTTTFGAGMGVGMNAGQLQMLWHILKGDLGQFNQRQLLADIDDLEKEMKLRSLV